MRTQPNSKKDPFRIVTALAVLMPLAATAVGCAGRMAKQDQEDQQQQAAAASPATSQTGDPRTTNLAVTARMEALEAKIAQLNEKLDAERLALDNFVNAHSPKMSGVPAQAAETVGTPVSAAPLAAETESGFINDSAIQVYRKAEVLLISQRYPDAILAFSNFLEKFPDHPLAGSAQFHVGEAYFKQKEYRQADQEFQKVLTSYDRSPHISETLKLMADAEDRLNKSQDAARHRQQLTSLFANSPAAQNVAQASPGAMNAEAPREESTMPEAGVPTAPVTKAMKGGLDEPPPTAPLGNSETSPAKE
jgi:TolA-binding protein